MGCCDLKVGIEKGLQNYLQSFQYHKKQNISYIPDTGLN